MSGHLGTVDARIGLRGPVWNIYVIVTLALAGGAARTVYLHPVSEGKVDEGRRRAARGGSAQPAWRDGPWCAREVAAVIPGHASTCAPARTAGADWLGRGARALARRAAEDARQGGVASGAGACVARAAWALGGVALAACATDPGQALAAALAKAQQNATSCLFGSHGPDRNNASWCGWHLTL